MLNKRFIAGAVCPRCGELDKVFTYQTQKVGVAELKKWRACAACDFSESLDAGYQRPVDELPTRVNQHRPGEQTLAHETAVERVRFLDGKD